VFGEGLNAMVSPVALGNRQLV
jgi:hypothetical protein